MARKDLIHEFHFIVVYAESRAGSRDLRRAVFPLARINDCKSGKDSCQRPQLSSPQATTQSFLTVTMNSLRVARAALRARPTAMRVAIQRRGYAEAVPDKIKLSLALPHQSIYKSQDVVQVNIPAESGEMGVLANHVPSIEQLKPGLVEVVEENGPAKQFFLSGGFATVQPNSVLSINSPEAYPLEDFSADAIRAGIAEAQKVANGSGSEQDIAEAKIELEVPYSFSIMDDPEFNDASTPFIDAMFLDGPPDDIDLVRSGYVGSRIRELNIKTSKNNLKAQSSPYVADTREDVTFCSPACQRTRLEVTASPPVGHSYPGLRVYDDHDGDNGVAWEVAATSSHKFNVKPSLRVSKSSNSVALHSPTRGQDRFRNSQKSNESVVNRADDARSNFNSPMRSRANLRASLPPFQTVHEVLDSSKKEQQDALDMFDMYGVSRPEGWLPSESERQHAAGMKTVQVCHSCGGYLHTRARCARCGHEFCVKCRTELVSGLSANVEAGRERGTDEKTSRQGGWRRGVTHSRSAANLSEPVLDRARAIHRLSHSKSSDAVSNDVRGSQLNHAEAERRAHQQPRLERRQRLEKSHSEIVNSEQQHGCPICHVSNDRPRHSICCIARQSQPGRQLAGQDDPGDDATYKSSSKDSFKSAHRRLEEQDTFWMSSEGPVTSQRYNVPQSAESGHQSTPRITLEGRELESEVSRSSTSTPGKIVWKTPATSRHISPSGTDDAMPQPPRDFKSDEQTRNTREQKPQVRQPKEGSPVRRADNPTPETAERSGGKTLGSRDSVRATSIGKNPQQTIESSDPSTWRQQLRKLNDTPASRVGSPRKDYTVSSPDFERRLRPSPAAAINDESFSGSPTRHKVESEEQLANEQGRMETTAQSSKRFQTDDDTEEPKLASNISGGNSELPISHHICEWRTRYLGLSSAFDKLKIELDEALEQQESQRITEEESRRHGYNDDGIEGLTIIVHRRFREDLVLNTDLRDE
ncbi:ATP synthase subunit delta [Trichoderma ghanense]|uniref:ATP synthase subunit delta, mitochondrial n=1 Tax=Trichoderma ghanense TaxID=65468 RepID=A0ABY2GUS5_9HYPO